MKLFQALPIFSLLALTHAAATTPNFSHLQNLPAALHKRSCGEPSTLICYDSASGGMPQALNLDDIAYAAAYLRFLADSSDETNPLWTMAPEFDCSEWQLPVFGAGTVLALAKHINPRTNSSVTYYDLARTIDGGEDGARVGESLLGSCGESGGEVGVLVDLDDPVYSSAAYLAGKAKPQDIIVKLVRDPASL